MCLAIRVLSLPKQKKSQKLTTEGWQSEVTMIGSKDTVWHHTSWTKFFPTGF
jgi:hypothetical protein